MNWTEQAYELNLRTWTELQLTLGERNLVLVSIWTAELNLPIELTWPSYLALSTELTWSWLCPNINMAVLIDYLLTRTSLYTEEQANLFDSIIWTIRTDQKLKQKKTKAKAELNLTAYKRSDTNSNWTNLQQAF